MTWICLSSNNYESLYRKSTYNMATKAPVKPAAKAPAKKAAPKAKQADISTPAPAPVHRTIVGKEDLVKQIAARAGIPLKEATRAVEAFLEEVRAQIAADHDVRLIGFGAWEIRQYAARTVTSVRGGQKVAIPARRQVGFSVGKTLAQAARQ